ncbi:TPA: helix-turn-helix transcriptional regulator [Escherichia coli]
MSKNDVFACACRRLLEVVAGEQKWCFVRLLITTTWLEVFMTKHDAIRISQLHQIFYDDEGLIDSEKNVTILYSIGFTVDEIAYFGNTTPGTVQGQLFNARVKLGCASVSSLKPMILLRLLLNIKEIRFGFEAD